MSCREWPKSIQNTTTSLSRRSRTLLLAPAIQHRLFMTHCRHCWDESHCSTSVTLNIKQRDIKRKRESAESPPGCLAIQAIRQEPISISLKCIYSPPDSIEKSFTSDGKLEHAKNRIEVTSTGNLLELSSGTSRTNFNKL